MPRKTALKSKPPKAKPDAGPPLELPEGDSHDLKPTSLLLDPQNLRLLEATSGLLETPAKLIAQRSVQDRLYATMTGNPLFDIDSLVKSIEYNGFLKHEQLIVAPFDGESSLVLEGNRRLTAVRKVFEKHGRNLGDLSPAVKLSLQTLPCFILRGTAINGSEIRLEEFRRASEIYIGMRHLMGAKSWEPASRYEFQWRLIKDGWTIEQVAERFGREIAAVKRDLRAQTLYRDFRLFEKKKNLGHSVTYNAFAEAARAGSIMKWLEWSNASNEVENKENEISFFSYLDLKLKRPPQSDEDEGPRESAESVVRKLRDMLKLDDDDVTGAISDRQFDAAELLFEDRREGDFAKRVQTYIRGLKRTTISELSHNPTQNKTLLAALQKQATSMVKILEGGISD